MTRAEIADVIIVVTLLLSALLSAVTILYLIEKEEVATVASLQCEYYNHKTTIICDDNQSGKRIIATVIKEANKR